MGCFFGAEDRTWTGTENYLRGILSPVRLPIPPLRLKIDTDFTMEVRISWRRHPDLNRGIRILQTLALPLGYGAACQRANLNT